ncbi:MAG: hypothetical protein ACTSRU_04805 [Candidatus Hodarchaeales archaeon]
MSDMVMNLKRLPDEEEIVKTINRFIEIDGKKVKIDYEFVGLLESIETADGFIGRVCIYDEQWAEILTSLEIVELSNRGSYHRKDLRKLKQLKSFVEKEILGD